MSDACSSSVFPVLGPAASSLCSSLAVLAASEHNRTWFKPLCDASTVVKGSDTNTPRTHKSPHDAEDKVNI